MDRIAYLLITVGFLAGSFIAVLDPVTVKWGWFAATFLAGVVGVVMLRRSRRSMASVDHKVDADLETLQGALDRIVANLDDLNARRMELPPYEVRFDIDRLFRADLNSFANARESLMHRFGIRHYADVMSAFAAGERYINRVWSASTDGYVDEVRTYLERAHRQFHEGRDHFASLH